MDSLVNGYDIPKIYVHRLDRDKTSMDYAVVDGKQRIGTIYAFLTGDVPFADDFSYSGSHLDDPPKAGNTFNDLSDATKEFVKECVLDVSIIEAKDIEDIEELFSRLNNGEKLNAAESRNAFGGRMASLVRELAQDDFFEKKFKFTNSRFAYLEVACKLLYLESEATKAKGLQIVDLKKKHLDSFVRGFAKISEDDAKKLIERVRANLKRMTPIFEDDDFELSKQSYPQLMYLFTTSIMDTYGSTDLQVKIRNFLKAFRSDRLANLQKDEDNADAELTEFGRLSQQGTNDAGSMRNRIDIMTKRFLQANPDVLMKDPKRAFNMEERWVLWQRSGRQCEVCGIALPKLEDLDGDHIVWHIQGGPTSLENARALCVPCNRSHRKT